MTCVVIYSEISTTPHVHAKLNVVHDESKIASHHYDLIHQLSIQRYMKHLNVPNLL